MSLRLRRASTQLAGPAPDERLELPAFSGALSLHHCGTAKHSLRVAENAARVGASVGLSEIEIEQLRWGGLLHDVGKIGVTSSILDKPGRLTADEYEVVKRHATIGADLVVSISSDLASLAAIIRCHHERWDGSGYPHGLRAQWIPVGARIVAVADVFDAMTEGRIYQSKPPSTERAVGELRDGAGVRYDPDITAVFLDMHFAGRLARAGSHRVRAREL